MAPSVQGASSVTVGASIIPTPPPAATAKAEYLNPGFDPRHDRTNTQTEYDKQLDYMKDQKGNTVDDYMLGDLLFQDHAASAVPR